MLGETYAWVGLCRDGDRIVLVNRTAAKSTAEVDAATPVPLGRGRASVRLRVSVAPGAMCQFAADVDGRGYTPVGAPFPAGAGKWIGTTLGIFATGPEGTARGSVGESDWFRVGLGG